MTLKWGGGFPDFAQCLIEGRCPTEELERALRFGWFIHRVEDIPEFSARDVAELFQRAHLSKPNVSRLAERLTNTRRTFRGSKSGTFRLTAVTLAEIDEEFAGGLCQDESPVTSSVATAAEEKLEGLTSEQVRRFVSEALECLKAGHRRAAVVLSWIGAIGFLHDYVAKNWLDQFNADAKTHGLIKRDLRSSIEFSKLKEADFLDALERIGVISNAVKKELKMGLDRRNNCGHPNDYIVTEIMAAAHIESLLVNVFAKFQ